MAEEINPAIFEFISEKVTDRNLNGGNFLQWKQIFGIHVIRRAKDYHLIDDPPDPKMQT